MSRLVLIVLVLAPTWAAAQEQEDGAVVERDKVDIAPARGVRIHAVNVDNRLGDVIVVGRDAPGITLTAVKRAPDEDLLDRLKVNLVPDPSGVVEISSALLFGQELRPVPAGQVRIDITLQVPRGAKIDVKAWNGRVAVQGLNGGAQLVAHDGDITVREVRGPVATSSTRGAQNLSDVDGAVSAGTTYGDLSLDEIAGPSLAARAHRGTVTASRIRARQVRIVTTFGDIEFRGELFAGGRYELRTFRGNIEVRTIGSYRLEAIARDGEIEARVALAHEDHPASGRLIGTYGSAKKPAVLEVSSTAGRVVLGLMNE